MGQVRMDVGSVVVGNGSVSSLVVLRPHGTRGRGHNLQLPIRIGRAEAGAISMGIDRTGQTRPMTHDLLRGVISAVGASVVSVGIDRVEGATFYAHVTVSCPDGRRVDVDARPSDAIALAVRAKAPIFAESQVLDTAAFPDFTTVRKDEQERELSEFHDFVESLSPEDFLIGDNGETPKG